jgi:hypothetical protein
LVVFRVCEQSATKATALVCGGDSDVHDEQVVRLGAHFDQGSQFPALMQQVHEMVADRQVISGAIDFGSRPRTGTHFA